jgi:hypothetical protein
MDMERVDSRKTETVGIGEDVSRRESFNLSKGQDIQLRTAIELLYEIHAFERLLEHEPPGRAKGKCTGLQYPMLECEQPKRKEGRSYQLRRSQRTPL